MQNKEPADFQPKKEVYILYIFEWDKTKAETNIKKHKVSFEEAQSVFYDEYALMIPDEGHSIEEDRFIMLGLSSKANVLVVCYCERGKEGNTIRIISSRKANKRESAQYWAKRVK